MNTITNALVLNDGDNVAVCLDNIKVGQWVQSASGIRVMASENIPRGHKILVSAASGGTPIIKRGCVIGRAKFAVAAGRLVDAHNTFLIDEYGNCRKTVDPRLDAQAS